MASVRIVSWNVDGLCDRGVEERASAVAAFLSEERPDVALLQEVTSTNLALLTSTAHAAGFKSSVSGAAASPGYYCLVLVASRFRIEDSALVPFPGSIMGRHLLRVCCKEAAGDLRMTVLTSHLESLKSNSAERKKQLSRCLSEFGCTRDASTAHIVVFAGDTNLRDAEVGALPAGVADAFTAAGSPAAAKFTWDAHLNSNIDMPDANKALFRCRFDRAYYGSAPASAWSVASFRLLGTEASVPLCSSTSTDVAFMHPSDHFGICIDFHCSSRAAAAPAASASQGGAASGAGGGHAAHITAADSSVVVLSDDE